MLLGCDRVSACSSWGVCVAPPVGGLRRSQDATAAATCPYWQGAAADHVCPAVDAGNDDPDWGCAAHPAIPSVDAEGNQGQRGAAASPVRSDHDHWTVPPPSPRQAAGAASPGPPTTSSAPVTIRARFGLDTANEPQQTPDRAYRRPWRAPVAPPRPAGVLRLSE